LNDDERFVLFSCFAESLDVMCTIVLDALTLFIVQKEADPASDLLRQPIGLLIKYSVLRTV